MSRVASFVLAVACATVALAAAAPPTQVHLYLTGATDDMMVSWVTQDTVAESEVRWGASAGALTNSAKGTSFKYDAGFLHSFMQHEARITGLAATPNTVFYQVGSSSAWSAVMNFTANPQHEGGNTYAIYADFGMENDVSLDELKKEVDAGAFDFVIHAGDFAYDLDSDFGLNGDSFLEAIAPIASRVPYMVAPGNHEEHDNFTQYDHRFHAVTTGPGTNSNSGTNRWYSFDLDLVHWVSIDTEIYHYYPTPGSIRRQLEWLEADLAKANANRAERPWIAAYGHKAWWMGNTNFTGFGDLFERYNVDIYFCGHVHNYERFYPTSEAGVVDKASVTSPGVYTNPKYLTTIVNGSPGCKEHISSEEGPAGSLAIHSNTYGFGRFVVQNRTHAHYEWVQTLVPLDAAGSKYAPTRKTIDQLTLIQENHGH